MATPQQTGLTPESNHGTGDEDWITQSTGLGNPPLMPRFFKVEQEPQRVTILAVRGFGDDGKPAKMRDKRKVKDKATGQWTEVIEERMVPCYAEVDVMSADLHAYQWQILAKSTIPQLRRAMEMHGRDWAGNLEVDVFCDDGVGLERRTTITPVPPAPAAPVAPPDPADLSADIDAESGA